MEEPSLAFIKQFLVEDSSTEFTGNCYVDEGEGNWGVKEE